MRVHASAHQLLSVACDLDSDVVGDPRARKSRRVTDHGSSGWAKSFAAQRTQLRLGPRAARAPEAVAPWAQEGR